MKKVIRNFKFNLLPGNSVFTKTVTQAGSSRDHRTFFGPGTGGSYAWEESLDSMSMYANYVQKFTMKKT